MDLRSCPAPPPAFPALDTPVLRTADAGRLAAFYRTALGFEVLQQVPGVLAVLALGPLRLQLWQAANAKPATAIVEMQDACCPIFSLHALLARYGSGLLEQTMPMLQPWGAWEFSLVDLEGNRLRVVEWCGLRV